MAIEKIHIDQFLKLSARCPVLDVRSPSEYKHAHVPGALNLALFTDEERKVVGTVYKQQSREDAIKIGLDYFGPKMRGMVEQAEEMMAGIATAKELNGEPHPNCVLMHCWRGGMRSAGVAWLLDLYGFKVYTLIGGYKKFRHWVLEQFAKSYPVKILGGYTGSGKTEVLKELEKRGEIIIDLEEIACHKGSAFGALENQPQPSQEMFENILATELHGKATGDEQMFPDRPIWMEDESQRIGNLNIPQSLWNTMRRSPVEFLEVPFAERLENIVREYGNMHKQKIQSSIIRIQKRLGGLETKSALELLADGDIMECFRILLKYYDKWYRKGLNNRDSLHKLNKIECDEVDADANTLRLLKKEIPVIA